MNLNDLFNEEKVRLDPKCWTGKKIGNPKTKMKGGVRVNNCVPAESIEENTLDEKSVSQAQFRTMAAAAHNPKFAKKVGISQDVAREFNQADKHSNYKKLPDRATEGEQQPGADYRDPKEVDYDAIDHDKSVARLRHLAGLGPLKTVYDPAKRVYKNVPTADQPKR